MQAPQPADNVLLHQKLQQQQQPQQQPMAPTAPSGPFDPSKCQSLYVGNLHPYVTEALLHESFSATGPITEVKIIKDKATGMSAGFGFVKYLDQRSAEMALQAFNGRLIWNQQVRVNWAFQKDQREDTSGHCHIFVGDLSNDISHKALFDAFKHCEDCSDARVMWDQATGSAHQVAYSGAFTGPWKPECNSCCRSKGYGFVSFRSQEAAERGIAVMNGKLVGNRRIRCGWAQHKQTVNSLDYTTVDRADPHNCNVYVGNISQEVSDADLRHHFGQFGSITDVKIYRKGSYGFVNYSQHIEAVYAIITMNGQTVGNKPLKCAWGRHQPRQTQVPHLQLLQMQQQQQMQNELGFLGPQAMLSPMTQMPGTVQIPSQMPHVGMPQLPHPQHAQQALQQQALLNSIGLWGHP